MHEFGRQGLNCLRRGNIARPGFIRFICPGWPLAGQGGQGFLPLAVAADDAPLPGHRIQDISIALNNTNRVGSVARGPGRPIEVGRAPGFDDQAAGQGRFGIGFGTGEHQPEQIE